MGTYRDTRSGWIACRRALASITLTVPSNCSAASAKMSPVFPYNVSRWPSARTASGKSVAFASIMRTELPSRITPSHTFALPADRRSSRSPMNRWPEGDKARRRSFST